MPAPTRGQRCEHLDSIVGGVGHEDLYRRAHPHAPGLIEPPRLATRPAPAAQELARGRENRDPVVAELSHVDPALAVERHILGIVQLARRAAEVTPGSPPAALRPEDLDPLVDRVGHVELAGWAYCQPLRPAE